MAKQAAAVAVLLALCTGGAGLSVQPPPEELPDWAQPLPEELPDWQGAGLSVQPPPEELPDGQTFGVDGSGDIPAEVDGSGDVPAEEAKLAGDVWPQPRRPRRNPPPGDLLKGWEPELPRDGLESPPGDEPEPPSDGPAKPLSPIDVLLHGNVGDRATIMSACGHVSMELLTVPLEKAGPYWTALEKAAAAHAEDAEVALSCISGFAAPVANDQLAPLVETGRAIETIAKVLRKHPQSAALQGQGLQALGGALLRASPEALSKWRDAGGIKMFVDAMVLFQSDPAVSSQIFGGVQYVAHNPAGVRDVVNIGAPLQGIRMLMKRLHETPNNEALTPDGTSLKCQILATLDGIIMNDADNSWSDLALEKGLMKELVFTMRNEKHRQTQNIGCANMLWLAVHNKSNHLPIIMDGGIQMMAKALADFNWVDSTPFMGTTVSETFNIQATCPDALKVLAIGGNGASKVMAKAGLVKTLITMPEELKTKGIEELMGLMCWAGACLDFDNQHTQIIGHKGAAGR